MPAIPFWLVITITAVATGANIGMIGGPKIVENANRQCAKKAAGKEWKVVSSVDKKGARWLQCHIKQAPSK